MLDFLKDTFKRFFRIALIFILIVVWVFSGWPRIWQEPPIPPGVQFAQAQVVEYSTADSNQFTAQVTGTHYIILVGGGGGGGGGGSGTNKRGGGGGGGGANLQVTISLTKGTPYNYTVGAAGTGGASSVAGTAGATTTFTVGATTYSAGSGKGGAAGIAGAAAGGAGGTATNGDTNRTGGTGGAGSSNQGGGGGASAAGTNAAGNNGAAAPTCTGGAYVANYGGAGGDGSSSNSANGSNGSTATDNYGGGGGGGTRNGTGGNGQVGYIRIVYNAPPTFTDGPDDNPDPVEPGNDVTFSATSTDGESNNWYLAVCKTDSVTAGTPPTCAADQTYCISSSAVGSGVGNTCTWNATGTGAQIYYAFACDNDSTYGPQCSVSSTSTVTVQVVAAEVSCSVSATSSAFGLLTADAVFTSTPDIDVSMSCTSTASGCTLWVADQGDYVGDPGLYSGAYLIPSADTTLSEGSEGYGIQTTSSDGGWTLNPKYVVAGNQVGGLTTTNTTLASSTTDLATSTVTVTHKAARSAGTPTGTYQDSIIYSCTAN